LIAVSGPQEADVAEAVVSKYTRSDGTVVVQVRGELDMGTEEGLKSLLVELATKVRPPSIVIDMAKLTFVDSTGIGALAAGYNAAIENRVGFLVRDLAPAVEKSLRIAGLYRLFTGGA
jgi:anti-anti-sigma factor